MQFHMFEFQGSRREIELRRESFDRNLQDGERTSGRAKVPPDFSITGAHGAFDAHLAAKISRVGAEEAGELPEVTDRGGNGPAKIGIEPVEGLRRESRFAVERKLIPVLLDVELLQLDLTIIESCA